MKLFVFLAIVTSVWYVMRWLQQFEANRRVNSQRPGAQRSANRQGSPRQTRATDTTLCSRCGTYVPSDFPTACDRAGCPFPGVG